MSLCGTRLYADEFVTRDAGARHRYEDAKAIAAMIWREHAGLFE